MGREVFTRETYTSARIASGAGEVGTKGVTREAERQAKKTGVLNALVDPAGFGAIRLSLPRVEKNGEFWELLVGTPMPVETRVDTTGSMGDNVDTAMDVLPKAFESWSEVLKGYDIQIATGIFGDVSDQFALCRPQFEMDATKIVKQLTLMVPERDGGDTPEDPDLGIFAGAYLCRHYINRIGLKGYDFTVTDAPGRGAIDPKVVQRVFGEEAFDKVKENGFKVSSKSAIDLTDVWGDLLDRAHAFVLLVGRSHGISREAVEFWDAHVGADRVIQLPETKHLPHVQAAIIGLTEGTLELTGIADFLSNSNMKEDQVEAVADSLSKIPIAAQMKLPNFSKIPQKGDLFGGKPDVWEDEHLWPVGKVSDEVEEAEAEAEEDDWK